MSSEPAKNLKAYRTAAILFLISGVIFIVETAVSREIGAFLPIGIALVILSIAFWQQGKKLTNGVNKPED
jgi:membrane-bound ClpP family serine protease